MHISSLPSPYGIGTLGQAAYDFADFLKAAGQHYWQLLPIGPTSYGDSPYQSFSTHAGNPYFIDLDLLREDGPPDAGGDRRRRLGGAQRARGLRLPVQRALRPALPCLPARLGARRGHRARIPQCEPVG